MIYIASPYWHEDYQVRLRRVEQTLLITRSLLRRKMPVFSPIIHGHTLSEVGLSLATAKSTILPDIGFSHEDWIAVDFQYLRCCSSMIVLEIDGWRESRGVTMERNFCGQNSIPVTHMPPVVCTQLADAESKLVWPGTSE